MSSQVIISGIGAYLPSERLTNEQLSQVLDTTDEWIRTRTGITERRRIARTESVEDMAVEAGRDALASAASSTPVDLVLLATTTPDRSCPAMAPSVSSRLGLGLIPALDISAVCSGFLYGLQLARDAIRAGSARRVLLVAAEAFSRLIDPSDRTTTPIFGDGAAAVILEGSSSEDGIHEIILHADGSQAELITADGGRYDSSADVVNPFFRMQGQKVFLEAVRRMTEDSRTVLERTGWSGAEADLLVGHQANLRILHAIANQLDIEESRVETHLQFVGNTAGASVPLALHNAWMHRRLTPGKRVVLAAFGGGATWGAATLTWSLPTSS